MTWLHPWRLCHFQSSFLQLQDGDPTGYYSSFKAFGHSLPNIHCAGPISAASIFELPNSGEIHCWADQILPGKFCSVSQLGTKSPLASGRFFKPINSIGTFCSKVNLFLYHGSLTHLIVLMILVYLNQTRVTCSLELPMLYFSWVDLLLRVGV